MEAYLEIHQDGFWRQAALLQGYGDDQCHLEYLPEYIFGEKPLPISLTLPVGFSPGPTLDDGTPDRRVPPFLYDMVPQGKGRRFLIDLLKIADAGVKLALPLLFNGAF